MRKLEYFEEELGASPTGCRILDVVRSHMDEVTSLVNTNRTVMVAWQRNHGPRFLMSAVDSGFDENTPVTKEIDGVTLQRLLLRMGDALQQTGSRELAATIARYVVPVMNAANECGSLADLFGRIRTGTLLGRTR
jgi:Zn-dependent M16 (insulinase) family peptidase